MFAAAFTCSCAHTWFTHYAHDDGFLLADNEDKAAGTSGQPKIKVMKFPGHFCGHCSLNYKSLRCI